MSYNIVCQQVFESHFASHPGQPTGTYSSCLCLVRVDRGGISSSSIAIFQPGLSIKADGTYNIPNSRCTDLHLDSRNPRGTTAPAPQRQLKYVPIAEQGWDRGPRSLLSAETARLPAGIRAVCCSFIWFLPVSVLLSARLSDPLSVSRPAPTHCRPPLYPCRLSRMRRSRAAPSGVDMTLLSICAICKVLPAAASPAAC